MKRGVVALLAVGLWLMVLPLRTDSLRGCCTARAAVPEMPPRAEQVYWTLDHYKIDSGIAYYRLYKNSQLPPVDVFDSAEVSQLQLPMHTYNGVALHRIVTLEVTDTRSETHWKVTDEAVHHAPTEMKAIQSSWSTRIVTLDGNIQRLEWDDATQRNIQCEGHLPVIVYIKNDTENLYLAISDPNDSSEGNKGSQLGIYFDENHDGDWPAPPCPTEEGVLWFGSQASLLGGRVVFRGWESGPKPCELGQRTESAAAKVAWDEEHAQWEARIPLDARGLRLRPGETAGLYLWALDWDTMLLDAEWPCGLDASHIWMHPREFGDLTLAAEPPQEFVPEASSLVLLTGGLMALLGGTRLVAGSTQRSLSGRARRHRST